jgi:hypothetical protein
MANDPWHQLVGAIDSIEKIPGNVSDDVTRQGTTCACICGRDLNRPITHHTDDFCARTRNDDRSSVLLRRQGRNRRTSPV